MSRAILMGVRAVARIAGAGAGGAFHAAAGQPSEAEFRPPAAIARRPTGQRQSLSFVLTLPFFIMILLFIVQVSQLMIGQIVVEYAAFAAARAAAVWIPAYDTSAAGEIEPWNRVSGYIVDGNANDQEPNLVALLPAA